VVAGTGFEPVTFRL